MKGTEEQNLEISPESRTGGQGQVGKTSYNHVDVGQ